MSVSAKRKQQKLVRQLQCQERCIEHIPYYLSGLSRAHFSDNLSRNSCRRYRDASSQSLDPIRGKTRRFPAGNHSSDTAVQ